MKTLKLPTIIPLAKSLSCHPQFKDLRCRLLTKAQGCVITRNTHRTKSRTHLSSSFAEWLWRRALQSPSPSWGKEPDLGATNRAAGSLSVPAGRQELHHGAPGQAQPQLQSLAIRFPKELRAQKSELSPAPHPSVSRARVLESGNAVFRGSMHVPPSLVQHPSPLPTFILKQPNASKTPR